MGLVLIETWITDTSAPPGRNANRPQREESGRRREEGGGNEGRGNKRRGGGGGGVSKGGESECLSEGSRQTQTRRGGQDQTNGSTLTAWRAPEGGQIGKQTGH